jgi:hypothetical protein
MYDNNDDIIYNITVYDVIEIMISYDYDMYHFGLHRRRISRIQPDGDSVALS